MSKPVECIIHLLRGESVQAAYHSSRAGGSVCGPCLEMLHDQWIEQEKAKK